MDVTVITPSLPERHDLLAAAMRSVRDQSAPAAEHLIGVDHEGAGPASVRTRLVEAARTTWVAFLDDDDTLYPHHLEILTRALLRADGDVDVVIPHCEFIGPPIPDGYYNTPYHRATLSAHGIFPITVLARRSLILANDGFRAHDRYEDWSLWNRMADNECRFFVEPIVTWSYNTVAAAKRRTTLPPQVGQP